tara:strand:+ start:2577 stop:3437 length:861 start_codon:yes stop_codon:yes gene_type:complete
MIQSMTGYGKFVLELPLKTIRIEIRALNSKSMDLNMRMPSEYRSKELELRKIIGRELRRGKVDISLYVEKSKLEKAAQINTTVVQNYIHQLKDIVPTDSVLELLKMAVKMPEAFSTEKEEVDVKEWSQILNAVAKALEGIKAYRSDEGKVLLADFTARIKTIESLLKGIVKMDPKRVVNVRERLSKGVEEFKESLDQNRFEQELIYYIEKLDITEETVRLESHLNYFIKTLKSVDSNGKKLGFISQEIGREINTIGSKANFAPMQKQVVQMKDELEKIKEQLLNVL